MATSKEKKENPVHIPVWWMRVEEAAQYLRVSTDFLNKARSTKNPNIPFKQITIAAHEIDLEKAIAEALEKILAPIAEVISEMERNCLSILGCVRYAFGRRLSIPHSSGFDSRNRKRGTIPAHPRLCAGLSAAWPP